MTPSDRDLGWCDECRCEPCHCDAIFSDGRERGRDLDFPPFDEVTDGEW